VIKFRGCVKGTSVVMTLEEKGVVFVELTMDSGRAEDAAVFFAQAALEIKGAMAAKAAAAEKDLEGKTKTTGGV